jgi:DNA-directed RNA polymerase, beta subunit/140 kD subunit
MTYAAPLRIKTRLTIKETGEIKEARSTWATSR